MSDPCFDNTLLQDSRNSLLPQDLPGSELSPFVHRFQTTNQKYVYDVNTRRILRLSSVAWDVIEDVGRLSDQQIAEKYSSTHGRDKVAAALDEIRQAQQKQGLCLANRPKEVLPPGDEMILQNLDHKRQQLILNVTEACNFRCTYCVYGGSYEHHRTHSSRMMSWDVAKLAIDDFMAHSDKADGRTISFYGGEPLLNLGLIRQCVAYVKERYSDRGVRFAMTTNGSLLKGEAAKLVAGENFMLVVSLDGSASMHDRNRRMADGRPTWEDVTSNIREFLAAYPQYKKDKRIRFNSVTTDTTDLRQAQGFWCGDKVFCECMGLDISRQKIQSQTGATQSTAETKLDESGRSLYRQFIDDVKSGMFQANVGKPQAWVSQAAFERPFVIFHKRQYVSPPLPEKMVVSSTCIPGARRVFVSCEGDYYACERVVQCQNQMIGNVKDGVSTQRVRELIAQWHQANRRCEECWCVSFCTAGCLATVGDDGVVTKDIKAEVCRSNRLGMHRLLIDYCDVMEANPHALDYTAKYELS